VFSVLPGQQISPAPQSLAETQGPASQLVAQEPLQQVKLPQSLSELQESPIVQVPGGKQKVPSMSQHS